MFTARFSIDRVDICFIENKKREFFLEFFPRNLDLEIADKSRKSVAKDRAGGKAAGRNTATVN